jgi:hypothetical protein
VNAMMSVEIVFHILQQGPKECTLNFETLHQIIKNISEDINVVINKVWMTKWK